MGRAPCCDKVGLKKGRWTADEDRILINYINQNGEGSWRSMPKNAGLLRCGKSCRLRWINYLRSDHLKRGNFTTEEQDIIIKLHASVGNKWSLIANQLPGRTDNEIKNYWNSKLNRRIDTFRKPSISSVAGVLPQVLASSSNLDQLIMNGTGTLLISGAHGVADKNNVKKKKGRGRTSRAVMKKNKNSTNDRSNKPKQVVPQHASKSIIASHLSSSSSSNSSCSSRCHGPTSVGNCYFSVLTLPQTPTLQHDGHQGLLISTLPAEDVMESLLLDTSLTLKNDTQQRPHDHADDLDAHCTEGVDLSLYESSYNFYDKLVVEVDAACGVNSNCSNSGGEEMRLESVLGQEAEAAAAHNSQSSGFEDCALAGTDWEWENIAHQHANDNHQQRSVNEQDGTMTSSWLWDFYNSTFDHQQDSNLREVEKNQKEAVVAWLLS